MKAWTPPPFEQNGLTGWIHVTRYWRHDGRFFAVHGITKDRAFRAKSIVEKVWMGGYGPTDCNHSGAWMDDIRPEELLPVAAAELEAELVPAWPDPNMPPRWDFDLAEYCWNMTRRPTPLPPPPQPTDGLPLFAGAA